ncbi:transglutaminase family protein [Sandarakinorhabdus sp.]|uniref:transglutaminase family protein n=1 Tax=Sandarakinorhabdus sp. TaxID=1916663 RepID=UPI003F6EC276
MTELGTIGLMDDGDIDLIEACIALSLADRPRGDASRLRHLMQNWAISLQRENAPANGQARALRLAGLIAGDGGFTGDTADYDNPLNADLVAVATRGCGLPIALSILYVALARRVGWRADALSLPGHVLVEVHGGSTPALIDPFEHGSSVTQARAADIARQGGGMPIGGRFPVLGNRQMLVRLISNQASRARLAGDVVRALTLYERLTIVAPQMSALWWERSRLEQRLGRMGAARASLTAMLETTHDPALGARIRTTLAALARSDN